MSSISYDTSIANTSQCRSSIKDSEFEKQPQEIYNLESAVGCVLGNRGNSLLVNTVPTSPKRKAPECDGTSYSIDSDYLHTPPPKRQTQYNLTPPLSTPPADPSINTECTPKIKIGNLDRTAAEKYMTAYFERHSNMKTDFKFRLGSYGYLEDRISQHFRSGETQDNLYESLYASNIIDWDYDSELLDRALKIGKVEFNTLRSQTKPLRLSPLPADQEAWADSLVSKDDKEL